MPKPVQEILEEFFYTVNPILLVLAFVLCSIYVNNVIIRYRLNEFDNALAVMSNQENSGHTLNMLSRFHILRQRRMSQGERESDLQEEIRLQAVAQKDFFQKQPVSLSVTDKAVIKVINGVRFLLGKNNETYQVRENIVELEQGYFYEQNRNYQKAKNLYEKSLMKGGLSDNVKSSVLLHLGFCEGILGNYASAKGNLKKIIEEKKYFGLENWKIAYKLQDEISELEEEYKKVKQQRKNALDLGRQMFLLGNYKRTISHLKKQLKTGIKSQKENEESRYLLGRAHEDLGKSEIAISYYKSLIKENPPTKWAKKANRRLYVMGKFYAKNKKLSEVAAVNSKYFGDTALIENLKIYEKIERASERLDTDTALKKPVPKLELGRTVIDTPAQPVSPLGGDSMKIPVVEKDSAITEKTKLKDVDKKVKEIFDILEDLRVPEKVVKYEEPVEKKMAILRENEQRPEPQIPERQLTNPIRSQEIFSVIITRSGELKYVFKNWKKKGLVWGGKISVRILIASSGAVSEAEIVDSDKGTSHPPFIKELLSKIKKWKFRSMSEGEPMISITFPITFKTSERRRVKF